MKTKLVVPVFFASLIFLLGCSDSDDDTVHESEPIIEILSVAEISSISENSSASKGSIGPSFSKSQQEVIETFGAIAQSIKDGDLDKLISFHAYGSKFTEFKDGAPRNGGEENEAYERALFGAVTEVVKFDALDLKVAVYYGNVANVTFHSDFHLKFGSDLVIVNNQITLLFVRTNEGWKMVHEHHSPLNN